MNKLSRILRSFQVDRTPISRVAFRWLFATQAKEYDILIRLQMLEGVAGVSVDTWMKKGRQGLKEAQRYFEGTHLHPDWLSFGDTGVFSFALGYLRKKLADFKKEGRVENNVDVLDFIIDLLMGVSINIDNMGWENLGRPFYRAGDKLSKQTLTGSSPLTVLKGQGLWFPVRKLLNQPKQKAFQPDRNQESGAYTFAQLVADITFKDLSDPMGKRIRSWMRKSWSKYPQMIAWLGLLEKGKLPESRKDQGALFYKNPPDFIRIYNPAFRAFLKDLWANSDWLRDLEDYAFLKGFVWDSGLAELRPIFEEMLPLRKTGA